jgi:hypothetical protein
MKVSIHDTRLLLRATAIVMMREMEMGRWLEKDEQKRRSWVKGRNNGHSSVLLLQFTEVLGLTCHNFARTICHYVFESVKSTG